MAMSNTSSKGCKRGNRTFLLIRCPFLVCELGQTPQKMEIAAECKPRPTPHATGIETMMKPTAPSEWDAETGWMTPMLPSVPVSERSPLGDTRVLVGNHSRPTGSRPATTYVCPIQPQPREHAWQQFIGRHCVLNLGGTASDKALFFVYALNHETPPSYQRSLLDPATHLCLCHHFRHLQ